MTDDQAAKKLANAGLEAWKRSYHPDRVAEQIRTVVEQAVAG